MPKGSVDFKVSPAQHVKDRARAQKALGRPLARHNHVHHHSPTQLVICEDAGYHALLHRLHYDARMASDPEFGEREIKKIEAKTAKLEEEIELMKRIIVRHTGLSREDVDNDLEAKMQAWCIEQYGPSGLPPWCKQ